MKPGVLLTLGRLPKGLDVARSFAQAGWRVIVADPHKRHVVGASRAVTKSYRVPAPAQQPNAYLNRLAEIIRAEDIELVLPVSEEILHVAALRERLDSSVRVFAMPQETLLRLHDKAGFIEFAGEPWPQRSANRACRIGRGARSRRERRLHRQAASFVRRAAD